MKGSHVSELFDKEITKPTNDVDHMFLLAEIEEQVHSMQKEAQKLLGQKWQSTSHSGSENMEQFFEKESAQANTNEIDFSTIHCVDVGDLIADL